MRERKVKRDELLEAIWSHGNWNNTGDNEAAKDALIKFLAKLKKRKPDDLNCHMHGLYSTNYIRFLLPARKALQDELYQRACNRISSLLHHECWHRLKHRSKLSIPTHIHINLVDLLEEHFSDTQL